MRHVRFLLAVPVAWAFACGDATQPAPPSLPAVPLIYPSFTVVSDGPPSGVGCGYNENLWVDGGPTQAHFDSIRTTFSDASACGDLVFDSTQQRTIDVTYALTGGDQTPYVYWWRGARYRYTTSYELDTLLPRDSVADHEVVATEPMPLLLDGSYDGVAAVLLLAADSTLQITDSAFTANFYLGRNYGVQFWAEKIPPVWDSVRRSGVEVTLWWQNRHGNRPIDSTLVFRNGSPRTTLSYLRDSLVDTIPGGGEWKYALKHVAAPVINDEPLISPNSPSSDTMTVDVGRACARLVESAGSKSTWKQTDQYLSAGCSDDLGADMRFRWLKAGDVELADWSPDTLFDFLGHVGWGTQLVILEDSNTTDSTTSRDTAWFSVTNAQVVLSGPTYITDKTSKLYEADGHLGTWFERYDDGPQWYPATAYEQTSMTRIWPWGVYTVDLRQHKLVGNNLQRGRLFIEVCSGSECEGDPSPPGASGASGGGEGWELFGAGPWIGWGGAGLPRALRLYDLWGMPDRAATPFVDVGWFAGEGGRTADPQSGWQLDWTPQTFPDDGVRAFAFHVSGDRGRPYVFSMAVDPDLGPDGADDVASYDAQRGMAVVADGDRAVGLLLRAGTRNALVSAQEYGVGRWAPTIPARAWAAQRDAGIHLRGTPRDVQLVLSGPETTGPATWLFVVIRGASPTAVRASADGVLRALP